MDKNILDLSKFNNNYTLNLKGLEKIVHKDSYEHGQGDFVNCQNIKYLNKSFNIKSDISKEELTNLIVEHLQDKLYCKEIKKDWIMICENRVTLCTSEIDNEYASEIITDDMKKYEDEGIQVYICDYDFYISINGVELENEDLLNYFDFEH